MFLKNKVGWWIILNGDEYRLKQGFLRASSYDDVERRRM